MALRKLTDEFVLPKGTPIAGTGLLGLVPPTTAAKTIQQSIAPNLAPNRITTLPIPPPAPKTAPAPKPPPAPPGNPTGVLPGVPQALPGAPPTNVGFPGQNMTWDQWLAALNNAGDISGAIKLLQGFQFERPQSALDALMAKFGAPPEAPQIDVEKTANARTRSYFDPQYSAIDTALGQLLKLFNESTAKEQEYGRAGDISIGNVYSALASDLQGANTRTAGYYDQAAQAQNAAYDKAAQAMSDINAQVAKSMGLQAAQQGLSPEAIANPQDPGAAATKSYQNQAAANAQGQALAASTTAAQKANAQQYGQAQVTNAQKTGTQERANLAAEVARVLGELNREYQSGVTGFEGQRTQLKMQEPGFLQELRDQLGQQNYTNQRQGWADRLQQYGVLSGIDQQNMANELAFQGNEYDRAKTLAGLIGDQATNRLGNLQKIMDTTGALDPLKEAQRQSIYDEMNAREPTPQEQWGNLDRYLLGAREGLWGAGGAGQLFRDQLNQIINTVGVPGVSLTSGAPQGQPKSADLLAAAIDQARTKFGGTPEEVRNAMMPDPNNPKRLIPANLPALNVQGMINALQSYYLPKVYRY